MIAIKCPEYEIKLVPQRILRSHLPVGNPGFDTVDLARQYHAGTNCATFPHAVIAAYHIPTGFPIGRLAIDGSPWSEDRYGTRFYYKYAYVDGIFVSESFQGCGIGTQLMKAVEKYYRNRGVHKGIYLHCRVRNVSFYQKMGYKECHRAKKDPSVGRYRDYNYWGFPSDVVVMYKRF